MMRKVRLALSIIILSNQISWASLPASDGFDGASLGGNWTVPLGSYSTSGSIATGGGGESLAYWSADSFNADQYAEVTVNSMPYPGASVRLTSAGGGSGYVSYIDGTLIFIQRYDSGSRVNLQQSPFGTVNGDKLKYEVVGTGLNVYINGVSQAVKTDSTYSSGSAGIATIFAVGLRDWTGCNVPCGGGATFIRPPQFWMRR